MKNKVTAKTLFNIGFFLFICLFLTSCASFVKNTKENPSSETIFEINLLDPLVEDEKIYLEILDDVTGITLNPSRYELQAKDDFSYFVKIPILNYSIVKYRYLKKSNGISIEHSASGELIQYRSHLITHPSIINDKVISWSEKIPKTPAGDISGFIFDEVTGLPIPEIFVSINGLSAISSSDGYFEIKDVPVGEYSLLAYHHEGNYQPFQQGAIIAENSVTPASFGMKASKMVEITFEVNVPENTPEVAALRIIGNIASLGNVFHE